MGKFDMLKKIKTTLESQVCSELSDLKKIDTKELGEVIDMIKDLGQTMYYCSVVKAMEDGEEKAEWLPRYYDDEEHIHHNSMTDIDEYIEDLDDMIKKSSQEEKQVLSTKLQQIANKINTK